MNTDILPRAGIRCEDIVITVRHAFTAHDYAAFAAINRAWVERLFVIEADDEAMFHDPKTSIVDRGGLIFVACDGGDVIGACALIPIADGDYEFSKMGVVPHAQGRGVGQMLLEHAITQAKSRNARMLLICTSSALLTANRMYRRFGFIDSKDARHHHYDRADVYLEKRL